MELDCPSASGMRSHHQTGWATRQGSRRASFVVVTTTTHEVDVDNQNVIGQDHDDQ
jgi:hypothetical protein